MLDCTSKVEPLRWILTDWLKIKAIQPCLGGRSPMIQLLHFAAALLIALCISVVQNWDRERNVPFIWDHERVEFTVMLRAAQYVL